MASDYLTLASCSINLLTKAVKKLQLLQSYDYERSIYIFLSAFRFLGFAVAAALIFTIPDEPPTDLLTIIIIGLVGVYTILKIIFRFRLLQRDFLTYTILGGDLAVCVALVALTGGVDMTCPQ